MTIRWELPDRPPITRVGGDIYAVWKEDEEWKGVCVSDVSSFEREQVEREWPHLKGVTWYISSKKAATPLHEWNEAAAIKEVRESVEGME